MPPQVPAVMQDEATRQLRKRFIAQREIEDSSADLLKNTLGAATKSEEHSKRFKAEVDRSVAIPELLKEHLWWIGSMPSTARLRTVVAEKWVRTLYT